MSNHITFGSRVTACDCLMVGRVHMVWEVGPCIPPAQAQGEVPQSSSNPPIQTSRAYYRVHFPPRSPFIGDWAIYRAGEIVLFVERPKPTNVNIVNIMRPRFPRFQT
jgi:hypothetical protein